MPVECWFNKQIRDKVQSNVTLLIFVIRIYSDMFWLLEAIFRLNIKECIYIYVSALRNLLQSEYKTVYIYICFGCWKPSSV